MDCQVIHSTEGRLRIRVPWIADNSEYADKLNWLLESLNFVTSIRINPAARSLIVTYETHLVSETIAEAELLDRIQRFGNADGSTDLVLPETKPLDRPQVNEWEQLGLPVVALGLALVAAPLEIPPLIIGAAIAGAAVPWFSRATESLVVNRQPNVDLLDSLWMTFHTLNGQFVAPSLKTALVGVRRTLRGMSGEEKERQFQQLLNGSQQLVWVERDGQERQIAFQEVVVGDRVIVYPGDVIPVDGQILQGTALIDERHLTGDPQPVVATVGEDVCASARLLEGKLCIQAKRTGYNTRVGLAFQLLQAEPVYDTRIGTQQAEFAKSAIVPTIFLGASIFALTGTYGPAITPFQLDFGSGIQIAMPTAFLGALTAAARHGVYIRSGRVLELLAQVDTIVFDRTGTLTQGNAVVAVHTTDPSISPVEVLTLAATAEASLNHPVATAIVYAAETQGIQLLECETWDYFAGMGIACQIDGQEILVGGDRLLQQHHVDVSCLQPEIEASTDSYIYVAKNGQVIGAIFYTDFLRPESTDIIATLQQLQIEIYVVTEDNPKVANAVATQLGMTPNCVHAHATSQNKAELVQALCHHGKTVAFVGDGINEAAALSFADVSISFASGSDIEAETADIVLLDNNLAGIVEAIALAKRAMEIVYQNAAIVIVPNLAVVTGGIFFGLNPIVNVVTNNFTAFLAEFFNSTRPLLPLKTFSTQKRLPAASNLALNASTVPTFDNGTRLSSNGATCIKQSALAKRLGLSAGAIARHRAKPEFSKWSSAKDPEGIAWTYDPNSKSFCRG
ncbi:hypothetical protein B7486_38810 [cyanobacterium TDX16]|nr:hypothetical protein B7486_38810 [cyanobacterium TDX16]